MLAHTQALVTRVKTVPAVASKTYELVAPRDSAGKITAVPPYVVVQPSDGTDTQERVTGPRTAKHPRIVMHIVGSSYTNCQTVTELIKDKFVVNGRPIQIDVTGEKGRNLTWSSPIPTQVDNDITPPLIYNTVEVSWVSEPA